MKIRMAQQLVASFAALIALSTGGQPPLVPPSGGPRLEVKPTESLSAVREQPPGTLFDRKSPNRRADASGLTIGALED